MDQISTLTFFQTPFLEFFFRDHLKETLTIFSALVAVAISGFRAIRSFLRERRIPLALRENLLEASEFYIQPDYGYNDPGHLTEPGDVRGRHKKLVTYFERSFRRAARPSRFILLAGSGMGKSSLLFNIYNRHLGRLRRSYHMHLIELGVKDSIDEIDKISNPESTVLLLDALDENAEAIENIDSAVKRISEKTRSFYRVVLTCRTAFFLNAAEIPDIVHNAGGVSGAGRIAKGSFAKVFLYPLTQAQISRYLYRKYLSRLRGFSLPRWKAARRMVGLVPNISVRPMLLTYMDTLLKYRVSTEYSFSLYQAMIYGWLERRKSDVLDPATRDNLRCVYLLAKEMATRSASCGGYFLDKQTATAIAKSVNSRLTDWQISGRSLLVYDLKGNLKFSHLSFLEVLLARAYLFERATVIEWIPSIQAREFIKEMIHKGKTQLYSVGPQRADNPRFLIDIDDAFEDLARSAATEIRSKRAVDIGVGVPNDNEDYSFKDVHGKSFIREDLVEASFRGANLARCSFLGAKASNADFTGAILVDVKFENCDLSNAVLLGANITGASFLKCTMRGADLTQVRIVKEDYRLPIFTGSSLTEARVPIDYLQFFLDAQKEDVIVDYACVEVAE